MVVLNFKKLSFLNKHWLIEICHNFLLIWLTCCLVSANKEFFFFILYSLNLKLSFFAVLRVKLWFSVFHTPGFHNFFRFLGIGPIFKFLFSFSHIIKLFTVHILPYWRIKKAQLIIEKSLKA